MDTYVHFCIIRSERVKVNNSFPLKNTFRGKLPKQDDISTIQKKFEKSLNLDLDNSEQLYLKDHLVPKRRYNLPKKDNLVILPLKSDLKLPEKDKECQKRKLSDDFNKILSYSVSWVKENNAKSLKIRKT